MIGERLCYDCRQVIHRGNSVGGPNAPSQQRKATRPRCGRCYLARCADLRKRMGRDATVIGRRGPKDV